MLGKIIANILELDGFLKDKSTSSKECIAVEKKEPDTIFDNEEHHNNANGIIDETICQGETGDCWLISGILSMSYTEEGAKLIKESIKENNDNSVEISFKGVDKTYKIDDSEMGNNEVPIDEEKSLYSRGDDDMLALELAVDKLVADETLEKKFDLNGGNPYYLYKLYGMKDISVANSRSEISDAFNYFEKNYENCSMTLGVVDKSVCGLRANHAYTIKKIDEDSVILVDPWNTSEEINVNQNELLKNTDNLSVVYASYPN